MADRPSSTTIQLQRGSPGGGGRPRASFARRLRDTAALMSEVQGLDVKELAATDFMKVGGWS